MVQNCSREEKEYQREQDMRQSADSDSEDQRQGEAALQTDGN